MDESWPKITIVTPSLNQGRFLEQNIQSIRSQHYPNLEHILLDGGSTDETLEVVERNRSHFAKIVVGQDKGQYDAITKGLQMASGEIMAWLNADDIYLAGALRTVGEIFRAFPEVKWLTTRMPAGIDEDGAMIKVNSVYGFTRSGFRRGDNLVAAGWPGTCFIQQESTFWRTSLWKMVGGQCSQDLNYAGDFELWSRFFDHADLYAVDVPLGCFRRHDSQKSSSAFHKYLEEAKSVLFRDGRQPPRAVFQNIRLGIRKNIPRQIVNYLSSKNMMESARTISYEWGNKRWAIYHL